MYRTNGAPSYQRHRINAKVHQQVHPPNLLLISILKETAMKVNESAACHFHLT